MKIINKDEFKSKKEELVNDIKKGAVFIHPTDTIYGLGCNAKDPESIKKLRDMKKRPNQPFSVIAPSKDWIYENCELSLEAGVWIDKLPGPYTMIVKLKNKTAVSKETNNDADTLGVRIPDHWTSSLAKETNLPIITTSANKAGDDFMTSLEDLDPQIKSKVNFILYEGEVKGKPSTLVDLTKKEVTVKER